MGKKVNGELKQGFLYQDQLNPIAELNGNNDVVTRFVYADKSNVPAYLTKLDQATQQEQPTTGLFPIIWAVQDWSSIPPMEPLLSASTTIPGSDCGSHRDYNLTLFFMPFWT